MIGGDTSGAPVAPFDYGTIKRVFGGVYMVNNGYDRARGMESIAQGRADLIAFGKPFISNPDLVARFLCKAPPAQADQETFYGGSAKGYSDYPNLAETRWPRLLKLHNR